MALSLRVGVLIYKFKVMKKDYRFTKKDKRDYRTYLYLDCNCDFRKPFVFSRIFNVFGKTLLVENISVEKCIDCEEITLNGRDLIQIEEYMCKLSSKNTNNENDSIEKIDFADIIKDISGVS